LVVRIKIYGSDAAIKRRDSFAHLLQLALKTIKARALGNHDPPALCNRRYTLDQFQPQRVADHSGGPL
jgi:hypothetical protein